MQLEINTEHLISLRQEQGLTQSEAANLIGVSQPAYQRYEAGIRTPSIQIVKEMAKAFNVSVSYITGKSKRKAPDFITIDRNKDPLLFSIVEQCRDYDDKQLERILKYFKNIS
ncbi:DNA-binding transcriptional regulator, XRE-family HTH domain [Ruminococcaceae bacterium YRB3002]|nr:DNA-binding transcriptional regulator, XRE-family HTH domain [Ruminococcaceae bacterium YRB3002]